MEETDAAEHRDPAWNDLAVLCAIAAGASFEELARLLDGDADAVRRVVNDLEHRGLLDALIPLPPSPVGPGEGGADLAALGQPPRIATSTLPSPGSTGEGLGVRASEGLGVRALSDQGRTYLLDHLATWTRSASKLAEERQHVERLRTDLLSTFSHELRTPLTLIRTSIGLLLDSEPDEAMRRRLLRNIKQSTDRMHILVTDLLDLARIRGNRFELQWRSVNLGRLVEGAVSLMRPLLDTKEQHVEIHVPEPAPVVPGDPRRLERLLLNLLGNANKFAAAGMRLTITVSETEDEAIIAVRDRGPGIPEEAMPHLFDQFFTARTSSSRYNIGAGLGLPIAKGIIEAHGGHIWVESTVGEGTTVAIALPKAWPREEGDEGSGGR